MNSLRRAADGFRAVRRESFTHVLLSRDARDFAMQALDYGLYTIV